MGKNSTPILIKMQNEFSKNHESFVYAPLANSYRKLALYQKAYEVLSVGLRYHPEHLLGHLTLAQCYFDEGKYELCYQSLEPWYENAKHNVQFQELFAQVCVKKGLMKQGLETYKYLLFLFPKNSKYKYEVKKWEDTLHSTPLPSLTQTKAPLDFSEWVQTTTISPIPFEEEFIENPPPLPPQTPIIHLALVDLYINQHIWDKALMVIEKMIQLDDQKPVDNHEELLDKKAQIIQRLYENAFTFFRQRLTSS